MTARLFFAAAVMALALSAGCSALARDDDPTGAMTRSVDSLEALHATTDATDTALRGDLTAPEWASGTETSETPKNTPTPAMAPEDDICGRTPAVQRYLIRWFFPNGGGFCRLVTGADLVRIEKLEITADRLEPGDLAGLEYLEYLDLSVEAPPETLGPLPRLQALLIELQNPEPLNWTITPDLLANTPSLTSVGIRLHDGGTVLLVKPYAFQGAPGIERMAIEQWGRDGAEAEPGPWRFPQHAFAGLPELREISLAAPSGHIVDLTDSPALETLTLDRSYNQVWDVHLADYETACRIPPQDGWRVYVNGERATLVSGGAYSGACKIGIGPQLAGAAEEYGRYISALPYQE